MIDGSVITKSCDDGRLAVGWLVVFGLTTL